jgi:uncharacterized membrane protein YfcA
MRELALTLGIGFVSGVLSGAFGIGGGIITTPAIHLILGAPALIAVGTPLPVIFPSALTGAISYARKGIVDTRAGVICGLAGSATAILGAWATRLVGGNVVLLATAVLILYTAADMVLQAFRPPRLGLEGSEEADAFGAPEGVGAPEGSESVGGSRAFAVEASPAPRSKRAKPASEGAPARPQHTARLIAIGALTGLYSGFLGLGGGFVLVPMLTRWLAFDIKRAIATSLLTITILAVPGTITHALLGHVDWRIATVLAIGVIPGAIVGARFTLGSAERTVRIGFATLLLVVGAWLAVSALTGGPS